MALDLLNVDTRLFTCYGENGPEIKFTLKHLTAFDLVYAVQFFASSFVKPSHVIPMVATSQTFLVERCIHVFDSTFTVFIGKVFWFAAFSLFFIAEPVNPGAIQPLQIMTFWTYCPYMETSKRRERRRLYKASLWLIFEEQEGGRR